MGPETGTDPVRLQAALQTNEPGPVDVASAAEPPTTGTISAMPEKGGENPAKRGTIRQTEAGRDGFALPTETRPKHEFHSPSLSIYMYFIEYIVSLFAGPRWTKETSAIMYLARGKRFLYTLKDGATWTVSANDIDNYTVSGPRITWG